MLESVIHEVRQSRDSSGSQTWLQFYLVEEHDAYKSHTVKGLRV